jgi:3,4-dihydroxy 2-butanone 4-phosphate synthase/GTP cyclohydrolase II
LEPAGVLVEILNDDGSMARRPQLEAFAARHGLKIGTVADLIRHRMRTEKTVERVHDAQADTALGPFRLVAYRSVLDRELHYALLRGAPNADTPTLVRVHVANALSDALHLRDFAGGLSAEGALAAIARAGCGILVVLNERESGMAQLERLRRPEPAPALGDAHWRQHGLGAQILADLGVQRIRVLGTPRRYVGLSGFGIEVVEYVEPSR